MCIIDATPTVYSAAVIVALISLSESLYIKQYIDKITIVMYSCKGFYVYEMFINATAVSLCNIAKYKCVPVSYIYMAYIVLISRIDWVECYTILINENVYYNMLLSFVTVVIIIVAD